MGKRRFLNNVAAAGTGMLLAGLSRANATNTAGTAETPGAVVLSLRGKVRGGAVDFDLSSLEALGSRTVRTRTEWRTTPADWSGVPLDRVLAAAGAHGVALRLRALNEYFVRMPMADVERFAPILARRLDGRPLSVRDRGPLIVIYPFDDFDELDSQTFRDRAIWQLREIVVE